MASGLPVVATNAGQICQVLKHKDNGLLVSAENDIDEIIRNILFLKNNPEAANTMGRNARKSIKDYYNWERVASESEKVLQSVLQ